MNQMIIHDVSLQNNRLEYSYEIQGEWSKYFCPDEVFYAEYPVSIEDVPKGVAVIPLLCNVLPVAWVFDARIILDEIDYDFYKSIEEFKKGYIAMYPAIEFKGEVSAERIVENPVSNTRSAALFSGGADAHYTLISHADEKPVLVTIWGSDIMPENADGWKKVWGHTQQTAKVFETDCAFIKTSFRRLLDESALSSYIFPLANDIWWHGFQHGIGLIGHLAPYAFKVGLKEIYIASSFTSADKGKVKCASDPSIDNYVRFCGCGIIHDGYNSSRQEKIRAICEYSLKTGRRIHLRVCWLSTSGKNCCRCEKCYRTILAILAEKQNPNDYGFHYTGCEFLYMMLDMRARNLPHRNFRYVYIQKAFHRNYTEKELPFSLRWFYHKDLNAEHAPFVDAMLIKIRSFLSRIKRKLVR